MKVLIPNPLGARRETLSIFHNMQIIQNGRHDVIDKYISLVCRHKQIYLMAFCQYRGADSKSAAVQDMKPWVFLQNMQIIQNGRHDVIDKQINLVSLVL